MPTYTTIGQQDQSVAKHGTVNDTYYGFQGQNLPPAPADTYFSVRFVVLNDLSVWIGLRGGIIYGTVSNPTLSTYHGFLSVQRDYFTIPRGDQYTGPKMWEGYPTRISGSGTYTPTWYDLPTRGTVPTSFTTDDRNGYMTGRGYTYIGQLPDFHWDGNNAYCYMAGSTDYAVTNPIAVTSVRLDFYGAVVYLDYFPWSIRKSDTFVSCNRSGGLVRRRIGGTFTDRKNREDVTDTESTIHIRKSSTPYTRQPWRRCVNMGSVDVPSLVITPSFGEWDLETTDTPAPVTFTLANNGNAASGAGTLTLSDPDNGFSISATSFASLAPGAQMTFTVTPRTPLVAGVINAQVQAVATSDSAGCGLLLSVSNTISQLRGASNQERRCYPLFPGPTDTTGAVAEVTELHKQSYAGGFSSCGDVVDNYTITLVNDVGGDFTATVVNYDPNFVTNPLAFVANKSQVPAQPTETFDFTLPSVAGSEAVLPLSFKNGIYTPGQRTYTLRITGDTLPIPLDSNIYYQSDYYEGLFTYNSISVDDGVQKTIYFANNQAASATFRLYFSSGTTVTATFADGTTEKTITLESLFVDPTATGSVDVIPTVTGAGQVLLYIELASGHQAGRSRTITLYSN